MKREDKMQQEKSTLKEVESKQIKKIEKRKIDIENNEENTNKSKAKIISDWTMRVFWVFLIGCIFGFIVELIYGFVSLHTLLIRKGLIYGPFIPVYGMGAVAFYFLTYFIKTPGKAFFCGMVMGGIVEYICSFFQELFFGNVAWDYSDMFLNLNGRTSLLYCFYWGICSIIFLYLFAPLFKKMEKPLEKVWIKIITVILIVFMIADISISCLAAARKKERKENIPARNQLDEFLDKTYPDEFLDKIYNNNREVKPS